MGMGDKFREFEESLIKAWIFLQHSSLGNRKAEELLIKEIWNCLENDRWHLHLKFGVDTTKVKLLISDLHKKTNKDIIGMLSNCKIERENSGSYHLIDEAGNRIICGLPPYKRY